MTDEKQPASGQTPTEGEGAAERTEEEERRHDDSDRVIEALVRKHHRLIEALKKL